MTGPVISPWWFYIISVISALDVVFVVLAIASIIALGLSIAVYACDNEGDYEFNMSDDLARLRSLLSDAKEELGKGGSLSIANGLRKIDYADSALESVNTAIKFIKGLKKRVIIFGSLTLLFALLAVLTPSKETMIQMLVASQATYENVGTAFEGIKQAADYILGALKG